MATIPSALKHIYEFGPFRLDPQKRLLLRGSEPVPLTPKAIETLIVLVESRDRVVSKDHLMKTLRPDSFVEESNLSQNIFVLRKALGDSTQEKRYILTVPGQGYQFTERVREIGEQQELDLVVESRTHSQVVVRQASGSIWLRVAALAFSVGLIGVVGVRWFSHRPIPSNGRAPLFVAEFTNATGDTVFDDVLREVVKTELNRSPIVEVVDDDRMSDLLRSLTDAPDAHLTPDLTRQVCRRGQGKLMMEGTIKPQGSAYVIELAALDCTSGLVQFRQQAESRNIDDVLSTLSKLAAATRLRLSGAPANVPLDPAPLPTPSV